MKTILCLLLLCSFAFAEKLNVKVIDHHVGEPGHTDFVPGSTSGKTNTSGDCGAYVSSASCSSSASGDSLYAPVHEIQGSLTDIIMTLLLPDGRKVIVGCEDHLRGFAKGNRHNCNNPMGDDLVANFSGNKAKLTWPVGFDGKMESETFIILQTLPASPAAH